MSDVTRFAVDRIEGSGASARAILIADADGRVVEIPRRRLGALGVEGAVLDVPSGPHGEPAWDRAVRDTAEETRRRTAAAARLPKLRRGDPGGDVTL